MKEYRQSSIIYTSYLYHHKQFAYIIVTLYYRLSKNHMASTIHLYGLDHSPWVQSVLLTLHINKVKDYTLTSTPSLSTMVESYKQKIASPWMMPALWYKGKCYYESYDQIKFIQQNIAPNSNLPDLFNYKGIKKKEIRLDREHLQQIFNYSLTRPIGWKEFRFWLEWAGHKDVYSTTTGAMIAPLFRPLTTLYMYLLMNSIIVYNRVTLPKETQQTIGLDKHGWPYNITKDSMQHFSKRLKESNGRFLHGDEITVIDIQLLGHFQCICSGSKFFGGLSKEVIPIIDEFPNLWRWLKDMHMHPSLKGYNRFYTRIHPIVSKRLGTEEKDSMYKIARANWFHFLEYYAGIYGLARFFPVTSLTVTAVSLYLARFAPQGVREQIQDRLFGQSKL